MADKNLQSFSIHTTNYHSYKPFYARVTAFLCNSLHIFALKTSVTFSLLSAKCFATCPRATDVAWKLRYKNTSWKQSANFNLTLSISAVTITSLWQLPSCSGWARETVDTRGNDSSMLPVASSLQLHSGTRMCLGPSFLLFLLFCNKCWPSHSFSLEFSTSNSANISTDFFWDMKQATEPPPLIRSAILPLSEVSGSGLWQLRSSKLEAGAAAARQFGDLPMKTESSFFLL